jgi:hypothetical protein
MVLTKQSPVVSNRYFVKNTKAKNVGIIGCDCHDILSVCLAMTKRELTYHEEPTMPFYVILYNMVSGFTHNV